MTANIDQTLMEQMKISDREIRQRMHMFDFTDKDVLLLVACEGYLSSQIDNVIEEFYANQLAVTEIAMIIGDSGTLGRLKKVMRRYVLELFSGIYGKDYVNSRLRIGKIHKRLNVSPKLYMASLSTLQSIIDKYLDQCGGESGCGNVEPVKKALHKILLFDAQLIFDAYIDSFMAEVDSAKIEVEKYASSLEMKVAVLTRQLHDLSTKDSLTDLYNQTSARFSIS